MKKLSPIFLALLCVIPCFSQNKFDVKEGAVVVLLKKGYSMSNIHVPVRLNGLQRFRFTNTEAQRLFDKYSISKIERTYPGIEAFDHPNVEELSRYYTIEGNFFRDRIMYNILTDPGGIFETAEPVTITHASYVPNDYSYSNGIYNDHLDLVNAQDAWTITKGDPSIKIAMTDQEGFFFSHPDYVNANSTNQMAYIHSSALNVVNAKAHGLTTSMAAAEATDNGVGSAGLGFKTRLMAFNDGIGNVVAAAAQGAQIINGSWVHCGAIPSEQAAIDVLHANGKVLVFSAGNGTAAPINFGSCYSADGEHNGLAYPAAYDHVISVGGVNAAQANADRYFIHRPGEDHLTFNAAVDVTAPGWNVGVGSATFNGDGTFNAFTYSLADGTSYAAPMVSGLAALILALKSDLSPDVVAGIIKSTATPVDGVSDNYRFAGLGGTGRIDAKKALEVTRDCFTCTDVSYLPQMETDEWGAPVYTFPSLSTCKAVVSNWTVQPYDAIDLSANISITILPGFSASAGSSFRAYVGSPCAEIFQPEMNARKISYPVVHEYYADALLAGEIEIPEEKPRYDDTSLSVDHSPNPAASKLTLTFSLPEAGVVRMKITDVSGRVLDTPFNEMFEAGTHEYQYDVSKLSNGVYMYSVESSNGSVTNKFVVAK